MVIRGGSRYTSSAGTLMARTVILMSFGNDLHFFWEHQEIRVIRVHPWFHFFGFGLALMRQILNTKDAKNAKGGERLS